MKKILFLLLLTQTLFAQVNDPSVEAYMKGLHIFGDSPNLELTFTMEIKSEQGIKDRDVSLFMDRTEEEKILIRITAPAFLSNMKYLSISSDEKEVRWMKTSRGVRRLSAKNNSDSLFGSDFTVEDLSITDLSDYFWTEESSDNPQVNKVRAYPQYDRPSYAYKIFTVRKTDKLLLEMEYFNENDEPFKRYSLLREMNKDNRVIPQKVIMENLKNKTSTTLNIISADLNAGYSQSLFNKANL